MHMWPCVVYMSMHMWPCVVYMSMHMWPCVVYMSMHMWPCVVYICMHVWPCVVYMCMHVWPCVVYMSMHVWPCVVYMCIVTMRGIHVHSDHVWYTCPCMCDHVWCTCACMCDHVWHTCATMCGVHVHACVTMCGVHVHACVTMYVQSHAVTCGALVTTQHNKHDLIIDPASGAMERHIEGYFQDKYLQTAINIIIRRVDIRGLCRVYRKPHPSCSAALCWLPASKCDIKLSIQHDPQYRPLIQHDPQYRPLIQHDPQYRPLIQHDPQYRPLIQHDPRYSMTFYTVWPSTQYDPQNSMMVTIFDDSDTARHWWY